MGVEVGAGVNVAVVGVEVGAGVGVDVMTDSPTKTSTANRFVLPKLYGVVDNPGASGPP